MKPLPFLRQLPYLPWHSFLVAMLPFLHFHERNYRILGTLDGWGLLLVYWLIVLALLGIGQLVLGTCVRAGLVVTLLTAALAEGWHLGPWISGGLVLGAVILGWFLKRNGRELQKLALPANLAVLVLVAFPLLPLVPARTGELQPEIAPRFLVDPVIPDSPAGRVPPDVYFILVDGLGQPEFLQRAYGLPRRELTRGLKRLGFRILDKSRANYPQTALSVAATFNMAPIDALLEIRDPSWRDRRPLARLVADNRVSRLFASLGYRRITFPSGYPLTRMDGVDERREPWFRPSFTGFYVLRRSLLPLVQPLLGFGPADFSYSLRRARLDYVFENLGHARDGSDQAAPVFVFAHVLAPHPPFVYDIHGKPRSSRTRFTYGDGNDWHRVQESTGPSYRRLWTGQAIHVVDRLQEAVAHIIEHSPRPPVIIIQGDHGPGSQTNWDSVGGTNHDERFGIFNAWYLPPGVEIPLQEDQTAINTFPLLLNALFGADLPLQEDRHWFARMREPYRFFEVKE